MSVVSSIEKISFPTGEKKSLSEREQTRIMHSKLTLLFNSRTEFALTSTVIVYELVWIFAISFTANCHMF